MKGVKGERKNILCKGIKRYKLPPIKYISQGSVIYNIRNTVNTTAITVISDYTFHGDQLIRYINIQSLCCIPETNTICKLYFNN